MENKISNDHSVQKFPVSVKGIILHGERILLLKNEREEWELPGGKLELGEELESCLKREIMEETELSVDVKNLIDVWVYTIFPGVQVVIVTYSCTAAASDRFCISAEHKEGKWIHLNEVSNLQMPQGYKDSIRTYLKRK